MAENINSNNNTTKEFEISWNGAPAKVTIRKMGFVEKQRFMEKFITTKVRPNEKGGEIVDVTVKPFERRIHALQTCLVSAPFKWATDEQLNQVDPDAGEKIYKEIEAFNKLDESAKKKKNDIENLDGP